MDTYYYNLSRYLLNINHQITVSNEKQRNFAYFGVTSYKSGLQTPPTMIGGNLGYYNIIQGKIENL